MRIKDEIVCFAHLRWCHNGWASNILIVVDIGYLAVSVHACEYISFPRVRIHFTGLNFFLMQSPHNDHEANRYDLLNFQEGYSLFKYTVRLLSPTIQYPTTQLVHCYLHKRVLLL